MVDRFQMKTEHDWICARPDDKGDWVRYSDYEAIASQLAEARAERDEAKRRLFPYADATEICGYSTTGMYLIGDRKSIAAARKAFHYSAQIEEYRTAFKERIKAAEAERDRLAAEVERLRTVLATLRDIAKQWPESAAAKSARAALASMKE